MRDLSGRLSNTLVHLPSGAFTARLVAVTSGARRSQVTSSVLRQMPDHLEDQR
jgi:hypothetical protein